MPQSEQEVRDLQQRYKNVFGTVEGAKVLGDILTLGHFGETLNPTDLCAVGEHNVVVTIARMAGAFDAVYNQFGMTD